MQIGSRALFVIVTACMFMTCTCFCCQLTPSLSFKPYVSPYELFKTNLLHPTIFLAIVLIIALFFMMKKSSIDQKYGPGDHDDDVRENIINYDDEGGGEDDMHAFDITPLRIPVDPTGTLISNRSKQNIFNKPGILKDLRKGTTYDGQPGGGSIYGHADSMVNTGAGDFADPGVHLIEAEDRDAAARALEDLRNYAYEGCGSTAGSLSSLASLGQDNADDQAQDFDYLKRWGPRFSNLAHLYSQNEPAQMDDSQAQQDQ